MSRTVYLALDTEIFRSFDRTLVCPTEPEKLPENPVLRCGTPGEPDDYGVAAGSVIWSGTEYRLYYLATHREPGTGFRCSLRPAVAFSADGIRWEKPRLGLVAFNGSKANNLLAFRDERGELLSPGGYGWCLNEMRGNIGFRFWNEPGSTSRYYVATVFVGPKKDGNLAGVWDIGRSEDGLTFTVPSNHGPIVKEFFECPSLCRWRGQWLLSGQIGDTGLRDERGHGRQTYLYTSPDLQEWIRYPHPVLGMDDRYPMLQRHVDIAAVPCGRLLMGCAGIFYSGRDEPQSHMEVSLVWSSDGVRWSEFDPIVPLIRRGNPGEWDAGNVIQMQGIAAADGTMLLYYGGGRGGNQSDQLAQIGAVRLRRDGFAAATLRVAFGSEAPASGTVTTVPLPEAPGKRLFVNAGNLSPSSSISVSVLDAVGKQLPGYGDAESIALTRDGLDLPSRWARRDGLPADKGPLSLRFTLRAPECFISLCPRLYAFSLADE